MFCFVFSFKKAQDITCHFFLQSKVFLHFKGIDNKFIFKKSFKTHVLNKYILLNIEVKNYQVLEHGMYKATFLYSTLL